MLALRLPAACDCHQEVRFLWRVKRDMCTLPREPVPNGTDYVHCYEFAACRNRCREYKFCRATNGSQHDCC